MFSRRDMIMIGGVVLAGLPLRSARAAGGDTIDIAMRGNQDGSRVWFEPRGLLIRPGGSVRWTNLDKGNAHTSTAYHPDNDGHPLRIPASAAPWNSDYLLPDQSFSVTLTASGVYDYFCVPHEHAGMVGRIVVAGEGEDIPPPVSGNPIPDLDGDPFPSFEEIVRNGRVGGN